MADMSSEMPPGEEDDSELKQLVATCGLPDEVYNNLVSMGLESPNLFVCAFVTSIDLNTRLPDILETCCDTSDVHLTTSALAARVRDLWNRAHRSLHAPSESRAPPDPPTASASAQAMDWLDLPPRKLSPVEVVNMKKQFKQSYPGELLTEASTPCIRLLSQVAQQLQPGQVLEWLPWRCLVSEQTWNRAQETRVGRSLRPGAAMLASSLFEDVPQLNEADMKSSPFFVQRILEVRRNAYVLCQAAHLGPWKQLDHKMLEAYSKTYSESSGLRAPTLQEFISADRKIWEVVFQLVNCESWTLDEALFEMATVRADVQTHLMPRARPATFKGKGGTTTRMHPYASNKSSGYKGKGKGKSMPDRGRSQGGKGKTSWPSHWARSHADGDGVEKEFCFRYHLGSCSFKQCKFLHVCPVILPDSSVCLGKHKAGDHPRL